jgi:hypothetical protein
MGDGVRAVADEKNLTPNPFFGPAREVEPDFWENLDVVAN